jgi:hypothetical protein
LNTASLRMLRQLLAVHRNRTFMVVSHKTGYCWPATGAPASREDLAVTNQQQGAAFGLLGWS